MTFPALTPPLRYVMPDAINSDAAMAVMITCPNTGKPIRTGMCMELDSWCVVDLPPQKCTCPECGKLHRWGKVTPGCTTIGRSGSARHRHHQPDRERDA
jgi:hypothetical protein